MITRICKYCGKTFDAKRNSRLYCSNECYHAATVRGETITCLHCGKQVYRTRSRIERGEQYCSTACRSAAVPRVTKVCPQCGRTFEVSASIADRYTVCSRECRLAETEYIRCERCGKLFTGERSKNGRRPRHFCSEECRRPPVYVTCETCGITFRRLPGDTDRRFCSFACYRRFTGESSLEQNTREALDNLKVPYVQEARFGRYSIDFLLPTLRLALEVDGAYWHQDPRRDARKTKYIDKQGWNLMRITDTEIKSHGDLSRLLQSRLEGQQSVLPHIGTRCALEAPQGIG